MIAAVCCTALLGMGGAAMAQTAKPATTPAAKPAAAPAATPAQVIPPEVKAQLDRMGNALRALTAFTVKSDVTTEDVLENNQKLQTSAQITMDVRRPNRMLISVDSLRKQRKIYYDGKQLTIYGPKNGYYGTVDAPGTIGEVIKVAQERYGLDTPLADLFEWGTPAFQVSRIKGALSVGPDRINGKECEQFAFRQDGADWQLWIDKGESALPCKLVIINTDDEAQPQTSAVFDWSTNMQLTDAQFTFAPPAEAKRIVVGQVPVAATPGATK
ncbi:hypothetical protein ACFB49_48600 [Sphingomonas sp. DBB INV C78]